MRWNDKLYFSTLLLGRAHIERYTKATSSSSCAVSSKEQKLTFTPLIKVQSHKVEKQTYT